MEDIDGYTCKVLGICKASLMLQSGVWSDT